MATKKLKHLSFSDFSLRDNFEEIDKWFPLGPEDILGGGAYNLAPRTSLTIPANYGAYAPDHLEIAAGTFVALASGAILEIG